MNQQPNAPELTGLDEYQRLVSLLDERRFDEAQVRGRVLLEGDLAGSLVRAKTHNLLCWTFVEGLKRASPEAVLHGEEAVRLVGGLGERPLQMQALCNLASAYHQMGDYDGARRSYQEIVAHLTRDPDLLPFGLILAYQGLSQLDLVQDRAADALRHLEAALSLCSDEESRFLLADIYRRQALVYLRLQQPEEAAAALARIPEDAYATGPRTLWWRTHLAFTRARVEVARGHWSSARPLIVNTTALARELADLPVLAECTCLLALVDYAEGRKEAAKRAQRAIAYAIHSGRRDVVDDVRERLKPILGV